ncbi:hypothetical protein [Arsukibacterium sp.]|uniref:hypothetical protein n=1 Tax=Arsukibacterium sp. TaxID=1977258 RepID=UPI002FDAF8C0
MQLPAFKNTKQALKWLLVLALGTAMLACGEKPNGNTHFGTPEHIATEFFHAIYNEKDLDKAKSLSTDELADLMASYGTVRQVARTLLNMSYDEITINVNRAGQNLREQYDNKANITLVFTGMHNDRQHENMRTVTLVKQRGNWRVAVLHQDRFSSSAR